MPGGSETAVTLPVLLLGDPRLRVRSSEVTDFEGAELQAACAGLAATLQAFRTQHGFGRAISAPQVGVSLRIVAVNLGDGPFFVVNPRVISASGVTFAMWDDCMSFPGLLVRLRRDRSISLAYQNERGATCEWSAMGIAASELFQHELDHLDGVLAIDRAIDRESIVMREVYDANRAAMRQLVDYEIGCEP
ncbi:MAG: peptide deformylase [Acidobacteria bacterium]|nr:peptide deformylase [Acidobacteriota bacterium]